MRNLVLFFGLFFVLFAGTAQQNHRVVTSDCDKEIPLWRLAHEKMGISSQGYLDTLVIPANTELFKDGQIYQGEFGGKKQYMVKACTQIILPNPLWDWDDIEPAPAVWSQVPSMGESFPVIEPETPLSWIPWWGWLSIVIILLVLLVVFGDFKQENIEEKKSHGGQITASDWWNNFRKYLAGRKLHPNQHLNRFTAKEIEGLLGALPEGEHTIYELGVFKVNTPKPSNKDASAGGEEEAGD